jgi:hypothetical protein
MRRRRELCRHHEVLSSLRETELRVYDALAAGRKTVAELHADLGLQPPCCRAVCGAAYPMKSEPTA